MRLTGHDLAVDLDRHRPAGEAEVDEELFDRRPVLDFARLTVDGDELGRLHDFILAHVRRRAFQGRMKSYNCVFLKNPGRSVVSMVEQSANCLKWVEQRAVAAEAFGKVTLKGDRLECATRSPGVQAVYFVEFETDGGGAWVGLFTPDRWVSESIEAELMHTGDKLEELIEDELVELGWEHRPAVEHFRDDQKRYTFRTSVPLTPDRDACDRLVKMLLAYELAMGQLGDLREEKE